MDILEGTLLIPRNNGDDSYIILSQTEDLWAGVKYKIRNLRTRKIHIIGHHYMIQLYEPTYDPTAYVLFGIDESLPKGNQND